MDIGHGLVFACGLRASWVKQTARRARVTSFPYRWLRSVPCSCLYSCPCLSSLQDCGRPCRLKPRRLRSLLHECLLPPQRRCSFLPAVSHRTVALRRPRLRRPRLLGATLPRKLQLRMLTVQVREKALDKVRGMAQGAPAWNAEQQPATADASAHKRRLYR